jgi:hypothetical protein
LYCLSEWQALHILSLSLSLYIHTTTAITFFFLEEAYMQLTFCMFQRPFLGEEKKNRCRGMWTTVGVAGELLLGFLWADGDGGGAPWVYGFCTTQDLLLML